MAFSLPLCLFQPNSNTTTGPHLGGHDNLIRALSSSTRNVRWEAAKVLVDIKNPNAAEALVETLGRDHFEIRWLASKALINLGKDAIEPLLRGLLHNPDSGFLRDGAHHVFGCLQYTQPWLLPILKPLVGALGTMISNQEVVSHASRILDVIHSLDEETGQNLA